jgi:7-cyano-7-deazaguanine synthase
MTIDSTAVVLYSGGTDSTACLAWSMQHFGRDRVSPLFVDYGQNHLREERAAARRITRKLGLALRDAKVRLGAAAGIAANGAFLTGEAAVMPGRNAWLLSLAASHASCVGADSIVIGCCADDAAVRFLDGIGRALRDAGQNVTVCAPFVDRTKRQIAEVADKLGATPLMEWAWSCYAPVKGRPCHTCHACTAREAARS